MEGLARKFQNKRDLVRFLMGKEKYEKTVAEYRSIINSLISENGYTPSEALLHSVSRIREHINDKTDQTELMLLCAAIDVSEWRINERARQDGQAQMP